MKKRKELVAEFEEKVNSIREKYLNSESDLYDLEESIFSEMQGIQKNLINELHQEKTKSGKKKDVRIAAIDSNLKNTE